MNNDYIRFKKVGEERIYSSYNIQSFLSENQKYNRSMNVSFMNHLNDEMLAFIGFLKPSKEERKLRRYMVKRIKKEIISGLEKIRSEKVDNGGTENEKAADTKSKSKRRRNVVKCFGSYSTELYLPTGDIDMTLFTDEEDTLEQLQYVLSKSKLIYQKSIVLFSKARVPILKFMDICNFRYDLSLNQESGIVHSRFIRRILRHKPYIRDMTLFLKYFLKSRGLNESRRGGLCSYAQLLMLISFLNLHPLVQRELPVMSNISVLFMDFFQLYGQDFCYERAKVSIFGYKKKTSSTYLSIEDPTDSSCEVGLLSTNMNAIRDVFFHAYRIMSSAAKECVDNRYVALPLWVKITDNEIVWRDNVIRLYKKIVVDKEIHDRS